MLSKDDNELMCRVGAGTPQGAALRRFWLPALQSSDLPDPDGDPRHVELLGEHFVAFRDTTGKVGFLNEMCCHRGTSLMLGRVEEGGIRCIYHGWKFAADGKVLDTPTVTDPRFKERFKAKAYPVREAGGFIWVYLGAAEQEPPFPKWPWFDVPDSNRLNLYSVVNCSFVQILEGLLDSAHLTILHGSQIAANAASSLGNVEKLASVQNAVPRLEADQTDFGFHYAALRSSNGPGGERVTARITSFVAPFYIVNTHGDLFLAAIPVNDERCVFYYVWWDAEKKFGEEPLRSEQARFVGLDPAASDAYGLSWRTCDSAAAPSRENKYLQDREAMRRGHFTGLINLSHEDAAVAMSAGRIRDRSTEMLSVADIAISRLYRTLVACARAGRDGTDPIGLHADTANIIGTLGDLAPGTSWRSLVSQHKIVSSATPFEDAAD